MTIYHPNIPQPGDDPKQSQAELLANFSKLNTDFSVNHVPFTAGGNQGLHTLIEFPGVQGSDPAVVNLQSALYPKSVSAVAELFFRNSANIRQLTNLVVKNNTGTNFSFISPWGLIFNLGTANINTTPTVVTFDEAYSSAVYCVQISPTSLAMGAVTVTATSLTDFTANTTVASGNCYYLAIGL